MIILLIVLLVWNIILTLDINHLENKINSVVRAADELFKEKQDQINDLYSKIDKKDYNDYNDYETL